MSLSSAAGSAIDHERRFYQVLVVAVIAAIVFGFARSFFLRPFFPSVHAPHEVFFYVHGVIFTIWLALLFTQVTLIGAGNVALHRRLGLAGFALVPLMVVLGLIGGAIAAHRPGGFIDIPTPPLQFLIVPYLDILVFGVFAGSALALRHDPQTHKRLMVLSAIALAEAGIARWPFEPYSSSTLSVGLTMGAFTLPMIAWDLYSQRRIHPATAIGAVALFAEVPVREALWDTGWWLAFAKWAVSFVS